MPNLDNLNFNRNYKITFFDVIKTDGDFTIEESKETISGELNVSFDYAITNNSMNTATFLLYNLSNESISLFTKNNNRRGFYFQAWYGDKNSPPNSYVFKGLVFTTNTYLTGSGETRVTEIQACDLFLNILYKSVYLSFKENSSYYDIIEDVLKYYGNMISLSANSSQYLTGFYKTKKVFKCSILDIFTTIANDAGLFFQLQNNTLYFVKNEKTIPKNRIISQTITPTNGLVGTIKAGNLSTQLAPVTYFDTAALDTNLTILTVTTLLRAYTIYDTITLKSKQFNGDYGILSIHNTGEYRGNNWYSILKLQPAV